MPKRNKPLKSSSYPPSLCAGVSTSGAPPRPLAATFIPYLSYLYLITLQSLSYYFAISILLLCNLYLITLQSLSYYFTISILLLYNLYPFSILSLSFNFLRLPPFVFAPFVALCSFSIPVSKVAPVSRASARDFFCPSLCALPRCPPPRCLAFPSAPLQPAFLVAPSLLPLAALISQAAPVSRASARNFCRPSLRALPRCPASLPRLSFCSSPARLFCRPRLLSLLVRWRFYAKRSVVRY